MLNIYDKAFQITNAKLYNSPYKENIDEVWQVLKNFKFSCRIIFFKNLRTLKIENVDLEKIKEEDIDSVAFYDVEKNKIYLPNIKLKHMNRIINHELFHASSSKKNIDSGVIEDGIGESLTEGITEYLALKSKNIKTTDSDYQRNLFVIEFLIHIYGEKILEPYFMNNSLDFFSQFDDFINDIIDIDCLLEESSNNDSYQRLRLEYLYLTDITTNNLKDNIDFLKNLELNKPTTNRIKYLLSTLSEESILKIKEYKNNNINAFNHNYQDKQKESIKEYYIDNYLNHQTALFEKILDKLIKIAIDEGLSPDDINNFMTESLFYKSNSFKQIYTDVIEKHLVEETKKR